MEGCARFHIREKVMTTLEQALEARRQLGGRFLIHEMEGYDDFGRSLEVSAGGSGRDTEDKGDGVAE